MTATFQPAATPSGTKATAAPSAPNDSEALVETARRLGPFLREHGETAERERRLPKPVLDALKAAGFQRLFTPRSLGGLEVDPVTCARIVEELAGHDTAAAWALQSANVNAWWACRLPEQGVEEIYGADPNRMVAAAFHPPQQATEVPGGFLITGRAPLASVIHDCEWILLSAFIMEDGQPRMTEFGPARVAAILRTSEVQIIDTWHTLGMRGTDSNDIVVSDVFVPAHRTFPLAPQFTPGRHFLGPLYRFPASAIIALFSAAVLLGIAREAITEFRELAQKKTPFGGMKPLRDRETVQSALAEVEGMLRSARALFYETWIEAWSRTINDQEHTLEHRADLLLAAVNAVRASASVTDHVHRLAGTTGIYTQSRLERCFRDAHTLRQHGFVSENKLPSIGQIFLGLPPDFPLIAF